MIHLKGPAMKRLLLACVALLVPAVLAAAETKTFEITVAAGAADRVNTPVCVPLPGAPHKARSVTLLDAAGKSIPAQITGPSLLAGPKVGNQRLPPELHFILPQLKANQTTTFKATVSTDPASNAEGFSWHEKPNEHIELRYGKQPVLRYICKPLDDSSPQAREQTYKVFHHLFDPAGERIVTNGPGGQPPADKVLYPHHRGIFYGFNKVTYADGNKSCDIWHCRDGSHQAHKRVLSSEAGPVLGRHCVEIAWHGANKELFALEERELTVYKAPGGHLVEFASRLRSLDGKVKLDGDPQHAGFQFRAENEVAAKTKGQTYYLRPDGKGKPGETRNWPAQKEHVNLPWDAMSFVLGDQRYTAAYLDKPTNPKEARFSERDYGRFGSYFVAEFGPKSPLEVHYRLWLQRGEMQGAEVAALSDNFVKPAKVAVK